MIGNLVMVDNNYNNQFNLNVENLINGIYIIEVNLKDGSSFNSKFVKK